MKLNWRVLCSIGTLLFVGNVLATNDNPWNVDCRARRRTWSEINIRNEKSAKALKSYLSDGSNVLSDLIMYSKQLRFSFPQKSKNGHSSSRPKTVSWSDTWEQHKKDPSEGPAVISDVSLKFSLKDWKYILKITENDKFPNLRSLSCNIFVSDDEEKRKNLLDKLSILFLIAPNLEELNLDDCCLKTIPASITNLTNLKKLSLVNNRLDIIPLFLTSFTQLTDLNLSYNPLSCFSSEIRNLVSLRHLQLVGTSIAFVPQWIDELKNLEELDISSNKLKALPSEIWNLENLTYLNIFNNPLLSWKNYKAQYKRKHFRSFFSASLCKKNHSEDPVFIGDTSLTLENKDLKYLLKMGENIMFPNLERLEVSICIKNSEKQRKFREKLSNLLYNTPNLEELTLCCGSSDLPPEIYELKDLRKLNLSSNKLKSVPSKIENLKNLIHLNLSNNELSGLTSKIGNLENLVLLNLSDNKLILLPFELENLKNLAYLDLSNNPQFTFISSKINDLSALKILKLN